MVRFIFNPFTNKLDDTGSEGGPGGELTSLTGNTGGTIYGDGAGNINVVTANSTVKFVGSGSTLTEDFAQTSNLVLGSTSGITSASNNVGLGIGALGSLTSGTQNTAVGSQSAGNLSTATLNTIIGASSGISITSSTSNTAVGALSLQTASSGTGRNTAIGYNSLANIDTGSYNACLGYSSGTGYASSESSNITVMNTGTGGESHVMRLGTTGSGVGQVNKCFVAGITGVNVGSVASVVSISGDQLGSTTFIAGTGIVLTLGPNSITVSTTGGGFAWTDVTGSTQALAVESGYVTDNAGGVTYTLPATAALGDEIKIVGKLGITSIAQNANQAIRIGSALSTTGITGSVVGTNVGDCITLRCTTGGASTIWCAESLVGNWIIT